MNLVKTISLIGLGAVGSAYLAKIAETIPTENLRVIASGARKTHYQANGVTVNGKKLFFPVYHPDDVVEPADLLLITVKHHHLDQALLDARRHIGPNTSILSLLNGITSEQKIAEVYGADRVLYALAIGIDAVREGGVTQCKNLGTIQFGDLHNIPGEYSKKVQLVEAFFQQTGISYQIPQNMSKSLWFKFMLNVGLNQVSAILHATYGDFLRSENARVLVRSAMEEVVALSQKEGICLTQQDLEDCLEKIPTFNPIGKTSTLQDIEAKRQTEVELFGGTVVELGKKHNIPVPVNTLLMGLIKAMEELYQD